MRPAGVYPFSVGNFRCLAVSDEGQVAFPATIYHDVPEDLVAQMLRDHFASVEASPAQSSTLFVDTGQHKILIDAGIGYFPEGPDGQPFQGMVSTNLQLAGVDLATVDSVIFSHLHFDHTGVFDREGRLVFPNARYLVSSAEARFWANPDLAGMQEPDEFKQMIVQTSQYCLQGIQGRMQLIEPGQELFPGIQAIAAPGHTPGHLAIALSSQGETLLVVHDAFVHPIISPMRPKWLCNLDLDAEQAAETRIALLARAAAERELVLAYHFFWPSLGHISKQTDDHWMWHPIEYRWD